MKLKQVANKIGIDISEYDINQIKMGLKVEKEHNKPDGLDVVNGEEDLLKITIAHLKEDPEYYSKLKQIEKEEREMLKKYISNIIKEEKLKESPYPSLEKENKKYYKLLHTVGKYIHKGEIGSAANIYYRLGNDLIKKAKELEHDVDTLEI